VLVFPLLAVAQRRRSPTALGVPPRDEEVPEEA
jgi:hypothetical protein